MKRRFTKLMAALALLLFVAPPMTGWGQTRDVQQLTNANIVAAGTAATGYQLWTITDDANHTWNAYAIKNRHSNATSAYHFLQIKKYESNTAYYVQVPELGTQITSITMTVSSTSKPMNGGENTATLFFSASNSTSATGTGVASGTGKSSVTIDCSSLNLNTGYITAGGAVRIWDVSVTYTSGPVTYTVTYDGNGSDGGTAVVDPNSPYQPDATVTVLPNTFTKTGNEFFCWSDMQDGNAQGANMYDPNDNNSNTFTITDNTTLYAQWIRNSYAYTLSVTGETNQLVNLVEIFVPSVDNWQSGAPIPFGESVTVSVTPNAGYDYDVVVAETASGNTVTFDYTNSAFTMPASDVTITVNVRATFTYSLANSIVPGKHYIIVAESNSKAYAMGVQNNNNRGAVEVTIDNNTIPETTGVYEFVISGPETIQINNNDVTVDVTVYTIHDANVTSTGYLCAASSSSNYLKTQSELDNNGRWTITFDNDGKATIKAQGANSHNWMRYNDDSNLFSCYSSGQQPVYLYVKDSDTDYEFYSHSTLASVNIGQNETYTVHSPAVLEVTGTITNANPANLIIEDGGQLISGPVQGTMLKNITGTDFGSQQSPTNAGYCVFASPINPFDEDEDYFVGIPPTDVNGLITTPSTSYDLYSYDAEEDDEWRNYKQMTNDFILDPCRGYLYANQNNTMLRFQGELNSLNEIFMGVDLAYGGEGDDLKNLTLVGNSYAYRKTFQISKEGVYGHRVETYYLTITTNGDSFELHPVEVGEDAFGDEVSVMTLDPMEAVFVYATDEHQYMGLPDVVLGTSRENRNVNVKVSRKNGDLLDNAIVSFGGSMMKKFYLTDNSTRVYFPISNKDYAVVRAQSEGEQPVNFKAKENGTYTLSIETKNVEMNYLHLIDNMTGADVDLLATPSYTFEAKTSDYASRFRLVFSANSISEDADGDNAFAYYNGTNWTISNMGEATLQVVDVMGRMLSSETLSGNAEVNINQPTGVYMLRLVNGDNVKVQKVVVR